MKGAGSAIGWLVGLLAFCAVGSAGCGKSKPKPPLPVASAAPHVPCDGGESRDPPHQEARPAIQALRAKDFDTAQRLFAELLAKYPESASLRVWRGDALLGQDSNDSTTAALDAYAEARALDARGCKLRERERYFLAVGTADAQLRRGQTDAALAILTEAAREWPEAPEVAYQRARVECMQGQREACFGDLEAALRGSRSGRYPRFSRGHRASEHLRERAEKQTEFAELRKEPRYKALLASLAQLDGGAAPQ